MIVIFYSLIHFFIYSYVLPSERFISYYLVILNLSQDLSIIKTLSVLRIKLYYNIIIIEHKNHCYKDYLQLVLNEIHPQEMVLQNSLNQNILVLAYVEIKVVPDFTTGMIRDQYQARTHFLHLLLRLHKYNHQRYPNLRHSSSIEQSNLHWPLFIQLLDCFSNLFGFSCTILKFF